MRSMRLVVLVTAVSTGGAAGLAAQVPAARERMMVEQQMREQQLRRQVEERFAQRLRMELGLTEEQHGRVRAIMATHAERRGAFEQEEQRLRAALAGQLRPGIAADADSVTRLVDRLTALRVSHAQAIQEELRELGGVLTPVQRGQLFLLRDRLLQQAAELRAQMRARPGGPPR